MRTRLRGYPSWPRLPLETDTLMQTIMPFLTNPLRTGRVIRFKMSRSIRARSKAAKPRAASLYRRRHQRDRRRLAHRPPRRTHAVELAFTRGFSSLAASARREGEKRILGPPPQPTLLAVRQAILTALAQPPPLLCPHCRITLILLKICQSSAKFFEGLWPFFRMTMSEGYDNDAPSAGGGSVATGDHRQE